MKTKTTKLQKYITIWNYLALVMLLFSLFIYYFADKYSINHLQILFANDHGELKNYFQKIPDLYQLKLLLYIDWIYILLYTIFFYITLRLCYLYINTKPSRLLIIISLFTGIFDFLENLYVFINISQDYPNYFDAYCFFVRAKFLTSIPFFILIMLILTYKVILLFDKNKEYKNLSFN